MFWIGIGSEIYKPNNPKSPISTAGCNWNLTTTTSMTTAMTSLSSSTIQTTFTDQIFNNESAIIERFVLFVGCNFFQKAVPS